MNTKQHKVIIIGGGMAGIKLASSLYNSGFTDVLVLEARDKLGGRLRTIKSEFTSANYDLGASWFHDSLNNPLFDKALNLGNVEYFFDDGKHIYLSKERDNIPSWEFDPVVEDLVTYINYYYSINKDAKDVPLKELALKYIEKYDNQLNETQKKHAPLVVRMWAELWHGESWEKLSAKYAFYDSDHLGRNAFVKSGYSKVFDNELNELPKKFIENNIILNSHVKCIDYSDPKSILIETNKERKFYCDYLAITIPQSLIGITDVQSENYLEWKPSLPTYITDVIPYISFGSLGKVILEFDRCFWPEDVDRFYFLSTELSVDISGKDFAFPIIFLNYQSIAGVSSLVAISQNPLSSYIENLDPESKEEKIWQIFAPYIERFATSEVSKPRTVFHSEWNNDPYARGSYATTLVGSIDPDDVNAAFAKGVSGRIHFAGAETVSGSANGCAHGAWFSGEREAGLLIDKMKTEKIEAKY